MAPGCMETGPAKLQLQTPAGTRQGWKAAEDMTTLPVAGKGGTEPNETPLVPQPSHPWALLAPAPAHCLLPAAQGSSSPTEAVL